MLVLRFGMVHETDCDDLKTTRDWLPFSAVSEQTLAALELPHCPDCLDGPVSQAASVDESAASVPLE